VFPGTLLQWEDFANRTSFANLEAYRRVLPSFNDDIQGTAAMVVGGLLSAMRISGERLEEQVVVIAGAGSAGSGIAAMLDQAFVAAGLPPRDARNRVLVLDSEGLIVSGRPGLSERKQRLAVDRDLVAGWGVTGDRITLPDVVEHSGATVLIGVAGQAGMFTEQVAKTMARNTEHPVIMPLSNPTAYAEAIPDDLYGWTGGRALVATGSPFPEVAFEGHRYRIGQANNVFIFPGVGLGVLVSGATEVTDGMFLAAARALAGAVDGDILRAGALYPAIGAIRTVSRTVAHAVAEQAVRDGVAAPMIDVEAGIDRTMWSPVYLPYRAV